MIPEIARAGLAWRPMRKADLPAVVALEMRCHARPWSEKVFADELQHPCAAADLLVAEDGLAGYVVSWTVAGELEIQNVVVAPERRRQGLAHGMLALVLQRAAGQGVSRALLEVRADNTAAIALYRQLGFAVDAHRDGYYHDGTAAVLMSLSDLSPFAAPDRVRNRPPGEHP